MSVGVGNIILYNDLMSDTTSKNVIKSDAQILTGQTYYMFDFGGRIWASAKGTLFGDDNYSINVYRAALGGSWVKILEHVVNENCSTARDLCCFYGNNFLLKVVFTVPYDGIANGAYVYHYPKYTTYDHRSWFDGQKIRSVSNWLTFGTAVPTPTYSSGKIGTYQAGPILY